jgi:hypothetical protein
MNPFYWYIAVPTAENDKDIAKVEDGKVRKRYFVVCSDGVKPGVGNKFPADYREPFERHLKQPLKYLLIDLNREEVIDGKIVPIKPKVKTRFNYRRETDYIMIQGCKVKLRFKNDPR